MENLENLRDQIDLIDAQLIEKLNARMEIVKKVGELKRSNQAIIYRPEREKAILDRLKSLNQGLLNDQAIEAIFQEIFAVSRNIELPERVSYLGPVGSFTHQAAESRFGAMSEYMPLNSIAAVFDSLETGRARFGVVPIENNQQGVVSETIDALGKGDIKIAAEIPLAIHFAFGSTEDDYSQIKRIYSKDIAFRQCQKFIHDLYGENGVELIPVNSTSQAAQMAFSESGSAAICSHIAARQYGLPILFDNIEDSADNQTRFLIISKDFVNQKSKKDKTTILAKLSSEAGSLATFLQDFHNAGINLSKIESRPAKSGKTFKYWFFIDFDGHFQEAHVQSVLKKHQKELIWLGSYPKLV
jgi:chorismate mutase / prephenate dehydratase